MMMNRRWRSISQHRGKKKVKTIDNVLLVVTNRLFNGAYVYKLPSSSDFVFPSCARKMLMLYSANGLGAAALSLCSLRAAAPLLVH